MFQKDKNRAANWSSTLLVFAQNPIQSEDHGQIQKVLDGFTNFLSRKSRDILVEGLGSNSDLGVHRDIASILTSFFKIWDLGGSQSSIVMSSLSTHC